MNSLVIFGSGGHSRSVLSLLKSCKLDVKSIYDNSFNEKKLDKISSIKLEGKISDYDLSENIVLAIGDNHQRRKLYLSHKSNIYIPTIIHPTSYVAKSTIIGHSNLIFPNSTLNAESKLDQNIIINSGAIIEHEVNIGSHTHISVGAIICGRATIGENCMIGAGAVVIDNINICDNVIIGANSVVITSITKSGTYVGNPVVKIR